jgi:hypothetical protein
MRTMVEVAARLYDQFDYNGVYAIVSGLQAHNIERIPALSTSNLPGFFLLFFSGVMTVFFFCNQRRTVRRCINCQCCVLLRTITPF